jgi:serine/threonine protein kinase
MLVHDNIIGFKEVYKTGKGMLCIVMEYANDGDLNQKITEHTKRGTNFSNKEVISIIS